MPTHTSSTLLLASPDPATLYAVEPVLAALGAAVQVVLSEGAALQALTAEHPPALAVLDATLPGAETGQLLASIRADSHSKDVPVVLITDTVSQEFADRLAEGIIDDLILRTEPPPYFRLRIETVLRARRMRCELESLRDASARQALFDPLTGVYNRAALLSMLFRETDRVQRLSSPLCLALFDVDDFGHWNERLGAEACDDLLCKVVERTSRILRSYDALGRTGKDEFLMMMPGCSAVNAMQLAERLKLEVFGMPFHTGSDSIRLSACFGVANSLGRSPVVVLREAEQALAWAKEAGPESVQYFGDSHRPAHTPVTYLSPSSGDELLAW
jgi:diguanylate cyclase (GGDEF)-like protein